MIRSPLALVALLPLVLACQPGEGDDEVASAGTSEATGSGESGTGEDTSETDASETDTGETSGEPELPAQLIYDDQNRALILHGINVHNASKYQPDRLPTISEADVQRMAHDWGFNVVRFLIFWDAVEPEPDVYDDAYLAAVAQRVQWFEDAGIYVILDMHQDVYSEVFCCDGAPAWAVRDDGIPFTEQALWNANYNQPAVQRAFDNFWAGDAGEHGDLQDHYVRAWQHVAEAFVGTPNVIGYDLMNEPFPGTGWTIADLDSPDPEGPVAQWESTQLTAFYERVIAGIREVDEDAWMFVEPRYGAPANGKPTYLQPIADPRAAGPHLVYYPHLYPVEPEVFGSYAPNNPTIPNWEMLRGDEQASFGGALMLGEFGIMPAWTFGPDLLEQTLDMADRATTGWTYWSYDTNGRGIIDAMGEERPAAAILTRTYARRVPGTPLEHDYDPTTRTMVLRFADRVGASGPTEIFVPASRWYPDGWEVVVDDPEGTWSSTWDEASEVLLVTTEPAEGPEHRIEIHPL
jgi:endoglycosylceramidase